MLWASIKKICLELGGFLAGDWSRCYICAVLAVLLHGYIFKTTLILNISQRKSGSCHRLNIMFYTNLESVTLSKSSLMRSEEAAGCILMSSSCLLSSAAPCYRQQDICEGCVGLCCSWGEVCNCCWKHYHRWSRDPGKDGSVQGKTGQLCSSQYTFPSGSLLKCSLNEGWLLTRLVRISSGHRRLLADL